MRSGPFSTLRSLFTVPCLVTLLPMACLGCQGILTQHAQSDDDRVARQPGDMVTKEAPQPVTVSPSQAVAAPADDRPPRTGHRKTQVADLHLIQAAALLDKGNEAEAAVHLEKYVALRPEQLLV